jgi:phosphate transport system permease protein
MSDPHARAFRLNRLTEPVVEGLVRLCGWSAIFFVFAIFFFVFREAAPLIFGTLDLGEFFTSVNWRPDSRIRVQYGVLALLAGTASVTLLSMALSVPTGIGAAIFVSEFCSARVREVLKIVIELLAAIPSVVWGFVGYMVLNPLLITTTGAPIGINVLNGGIILALMSVPIIMSVGEDALKVLMATGHAVQIPDSLLDPVRTLTATIAAELGETVEGGDHYRVLFVIGTLLMLMAFAVNLTADLVVKGIRGKQNG